MASNFSDMIVATANSLGMSPLDLATIISYETAGTFDPLKRGPTTQWGQHRGLIQFGEPQAQRFGVDWNDPLGSQLGPDGAVAKYFKASGWKPGMSMLDAYSIVNAGGPGRYGASDANNGGAPGTVRDKVESRAMAQHRAKAQALLGGDFAPQSLSGIGSPNVFGAMTTNSIASGGNEPPAGAAAWALAEDGGGGRLSKAGEFFDQAMSEVRPPRIAPMPNPPQGAGDALMKLLKNPNALAQALMSRRLA